jgi:protein gp37
VGDRTGISWTDASWNPIRGCSRVSQGCVHCYAETVAARFAKPGQPYEGLTDQHGRWNGKIMVVERHMMDPISWQRPRRIFVNSMSDLFHENLPDVVIDRIFAIMALASRHTFQVLTKRPGRMLKWFNVTPSGASREQLVFDARLYASAGLSVPIFHRSPNSWPGWPLPNVWLGVSTEDQHTLEARVPELLRAPAVVHWISAEPLLGALDVSRYVVAATESHGHGVTYSERTTPALDWVVIGGESGPGHRPMDPTWAESIAEQCDRAGVAVFVKQDSGSKPGKQGRLSDDLWRLKEFPRAA